ncbi:MAG TPA: dephospho-CoA kinase [Vicinamibacterales bacterium]|jgi:dephospho-CoA kinase|nr:dephospho-CoA kinase [Vicinamibacterales bacterium]
MLKIALTGGIATGKSYVLDRFRRLGVPCLDADDLAHGVTAAGTEATARIAERFGAEVIATDGSVDRARLGPIVFDDAAARRDLEAIVHPAVYRAVAAGLRAIELTERPRFAVVAIPLLYETGHAGDFDRVIATVCPLKLQLARLRERGLDEDAVRLRLAAQWTADEKAARADFVIRTDGTYADTDAQVAAVQRQLDGGQP